MELYLHIGTEKTGTSSIQEFMRANRALLQTRGVVYPRSPGDINHIGLAALGQDRDRGELWEKLGITSIAGRDRYRIQLANDLSTELREKEYGRAVMSNEHCSSRLLSGEEVSSLRNFLSSLFSRIRIVVYLRRQDDFVVSTYSTGIKSGRTTPLRLPKANRIRGRYDYWDLLERWSGIFGRENIVCRKFEKESLTSGDLLTDFLTVVGCDASAEWQHPGNVNSSLDARALDFLRLMNLHIMPDDRPPRLVPKLEALSDGPLIDLSPADRSELMKQVRGSNALVAETYFGGRRTDSDDPLFAPRADRRERICDVKLRSEEAVSMAARLLSMDPPRGRRRGGKLAFETDAVSQA
jgi:hypothetical protein